MTEPLEQLAARSVAGDRAALEALCRALQGPIYRLAQRMLGHPADAEDCTQEIGAEICDIEPDAFRQRLARARSKLRPVLEERCGLVEPAHPCRCVRGVIAKQRAGLRLPVYQDAMADGVDRASEQLGSLRRLGGELASSRRRSRAPACGPSSPPGCRTC